ncbi:helix-turn-helix transcriptional regulator [Sphingomicrobium arenosum]|uniref:helix-turn-helix transcriptional regulator n=1 Tax=Sphingomicrobium arenosum TaxID=2233861 RepID=UPI00223F2911|nr:helix-turn-helix transcriptional regulator [Sphingomicrobium arenosum]
MAYASRHLFHFFDRLARLDERSLNAEQRFVRASAAFYDYLHSLGIEHCNFGVFETRGGEVEPVNFAGTRLSSGFMEEYAGEHMEQDDYVLLAASQLDAKRSTADFRVGREVALGWGEPLEASRQVQLRCADAGIEEGRAYIGQRRDFRGPDGAARYFGFVFAGSDKRGGEQAHRHFNEARVAAHSLMDKFGHAMDARQDAFDYDLTPRETEMVRLLAAGLQRSQIAEKRKLSLSTVDMHLANLRQKLGATTLAEAVAKAFRYGIIR